MENNLYKFSDARSKFKQVLDESCTSPVIILYEKRKFEVRLVQENTELKEIVQVLNKSRVEIAKETLRQIEEEYKEPEIKKEKCYRCNTKQEIYKETFKFGKRVKVCRECFDQEVCV